MLVKFGMKCAANEQNDCQTTHKKFQYSQNFKQYVQKV